MRVCVGHFRLVTTAENFPFLIEIVDINHKLSHRGFLMHLFVRQLLSLLSLLFDCLCLFRRKSVNEFVLCCSFVSSLFCSNYLSNIIDTKYQQHTYVGKTTKASHKNDIKTSLCHHTYC